MIRDQETLLQPQDSVRRFVHCFVHPARLWRNDEDTAQIRRRGSARAMIGAART